MDQFWLFALLPLIAVLCGLLAHEASQTILSLYRGERRLRPVRAPARALRKLAKDQSFIS